MAVACLYIDLPEWLESSDQGREVLVEFIRKFYLNAVSLFKSSPCFHCQRLPRFGPRPPPESIRHDV